MDNSGEQRLEERIARLESKVRQLENQLNQKSSEINHTVFVDVSSEQEPQEIPDHQQAVPRVGEKLQLGENWLNRIGIGLLLLGVAFLFKYSIDQGWLIPPVRSAIGLGIGLTLFASGLQLNTSRSPMKELLMGGGIAAFYITGFATFQLYSFISHPVVWAFMVIVTLLSLSLSLQQNVPVLSVIGTLGGLGTPFMLYTGEGSLVLLVVYTVLILTGSSIIYLNKGWKSLLWAMAIGGSLVMCVGLVNGMQETVGLRTPERVALQLGVVYAMLVVWILPVMREMMLARGSWWWPDPDSDGDHYNPVAQIMALLVPIGSVIYSMVLWDVEWEAWGAVSMAFSVIVGYTYLPLRGSGLKNMASVHAFSALVLLTVSFFLLFEGNLLFIILTFEGLGLRLVFVGSQDDRISAASHFLFVITGVWLLNNLTDTPALGSGVLDLEAFTMLVIIGIAGIAVPLWLKGKNERLVYRAGSHLALLGWFLHEFSALDNGQAFVSVGWGLYAVVLLVAGLIYNLQWLRLAGMGTIILVVIKLFLIDLSQLQAIWRILLFIGFGTLFLIIGYFIQVKFAQRPDSGQEPDALI